MTNEPFPIVMDAYLDGGESQVPAKAQEPPNSVTPAGINGYVDPQNERVESGRQGTMAQSMRPAPAGIHGVVIPKSTLGGIPQGFHPHALKDVYVNIDPHINGQSSRVRLGDVTSQSVADAHEAARGLTPEPTSMETRRLRSSAIFHLVAAGSQSKKENSLPPEPDPQQSPFPAQPQQNGMQQQQPQQFSPPPRRRVSPLSAFDQPAPAAQQPATPAPPAAAAPVESPPIHVIFEMTNVGEYEAYYHDVIVEKGFIVLVFDSRFRGPKYFPPVMSGSPEQRLALNVVGTREVYEVETTGVHYKHNDSEYCILMINKQDTMADPLA